MILCASKDDEVVEYAMSRTMSPMMVAEYKLQLPDKEVLQKKLQELINIPLIEISKKHRGNHYATKVLEWAIKYFKRCGFKELSLEAAGRSPDAIHIYEKLGFKKLKQISEKDIWGGLTEMKLKL